MRSCRYSVLLVLTVLLFLAFPRAQAQLTAEDETKPTFVIHDAATNDFKDHDLRLLIYGDMRFTDPANTTDTNPRVRQWLARKVAEEKPDAMLVTGDIPFHGSDASDWQRFRIEAASWWQQNLRVFPTVGNHEVIPSATSGYANYFAAFPQLHGYHIYSVLMGNVYIMALDSSERVWPNSYQAEWVRQQLDHLPPQVDFVFFLVHVPLMADVQTEFIANTPSPDLVALRTYLESRAATLHAKFVVVNGHIHNYERFEQNGITHIISGGGGAKPYPIYIAGDQDLYRDHLAAPNFNYVILTIHGTHADARMYRVIDPSAPQLSVKLSDSFSLDARPRTAAQK